MRYYSACGVVVWVTLHLPRSGSPGLLVCDGMFLLLHHCHHGSDYLHERSAQQEQASGSSWLYGQRFSVHLHLGIALPASAYSNFNWSCAMHCNTKNIDSFYPYTWYYMIFLYVIDFQIGVFKSDWIPEKIRCFCGTKYQNFTLETRFVGKTIE